MNQDYILLFFSSKLESAKKFLEVLERHLIHRTIWFPAVVAKNPGQEHEIVYHLHSVQTSKYSTVNF